MKNHFSRNGFTLIELLIVVAIIAILAAIAIPNFLAAQVRAKVSRAKAEMRTIATSLEAYVVDYNTYPMNPNVYWHPSYPYVTPVALTTPVPYITRIPSDPFGNFSAVTVLTTDPVYPEYKKTALYYSYNQIYAADDIYSDGQYTMNVDHEHGNRGAMRKFGKWVQTSLGPDLVGKAMGCVDGYGEFDGLYYWDISYDPTNGTNSYGNIITTQINPAGLGVDHLP